MSLDPNSTSEEVPASAIRVMQIIHFALLAGVCAFLAFVLFQRFTGPAPNGPPASQAEPNQMLGVFAAGFFVMAGGMSFVLPSLMAKGQMAAATRPDFKLPLANSDKAYLPATLTGYLTGIYQVSLIIGLALLEGPAFFGAFALMSTGQLWTIAIPLVAIALMALRFPSAMRVRMWVDARREEIMQSRAADGLGDRIV